MEKIPKITLSIIRQLAIEQSYERGEYYYRSGAVVEAIQRGKTISAQVEGSYYEPYRVTVTFNKRTIKDSCCSCPYDWGGICKHIVAVLFTCADDPSSIVERSEPCQLLKNVDRTELYGLLTNLLEEHPNLIDWVEARLLTKNQKPSKGKQRKTSVDEKNIRMQVRNYFASLENMHPYYVANQLPGELSTIEDQAKEFLENNDGISAQSILITFMEELIAHIESIDDSGGCVGDYIIELGYPLAEAVLSSSFTKAGRKLLVARLEKLCSSLGNYGMEEGARLALMVAEKGWSSGKITHAHSPEINKMKLNILSRQGKDEEFLELAVFTGNHLRYALKLVELDRIKDVMTYAKKYIQLAEEIHPLAQKIYQKDFLQEALSLAEWGLSIVGDKYHLGNWINEVVGDDHELALRANIEAFRSVPTFSLYQSINDLAGKKWDKIRPEVMKILNKTGNSQAIIEVLLSENNIKEAIKVVEKEKHDYRLLNKVVDAAMQAHPDWVIRIATQQAEELIQRKQSKYYSVSVNWLRKVKKAFNKNKQPKKWKLYLDKLKTQHRRKYSLMEQLKSLE